MFKQWSRLLRQIDNEKGTALILSYLVLTVVFTLTTGLALSHVNELSHANRYRDSTAAFWVAEAGINRYINDPTMLDGGPQTITIGAHSVTLSKDDTNPTFRILNSSGTANSINRQLEVTFPATAPGAFDNTLSAGGNVSINYIGGWFDVDDKTRITGAVSESGFIGGGDFEDLVEGVDPGLTTLTYPDADGNATPDEFNDFVTFNQNLINTYDPNDVVYIASDSTVTIFPSSALVDKKIVYVEGSTPGSGDVNIFFDPTWAANQNITVISTGSVNYIQPLQNPAANSQLNTISWDNYAEGSIFISAHSGVNYSHADVDYAGLISYSVTEGAVVANNDVSAYMLGVIKAFDYENPIDPVTGLVPPGFEGLIGTSSGGYSTTPSDWKEI